MRCTRIVSLAGLCWLAGALAVIGQQAGQPASLRVHVPADARLKIDDHLTKQTGEVRTFVTPPLAPGRSYRYTLTLLVPRGSFENVRMRVVQVRPGQETVIDLRPGKDDGSSPIVYAPTPDNVIEEMLRLAGVTKDDVVYDLGCGDGRILITAAKKYGVRGVGVDIDPKWVREAQAAVQKEKLEHLVEIRHGDALQVDDLARATVVTLYMLPEFMRKLKPILPEKLKPGARIVSHDFPMEDWKPAREMEVQGPERAHQLYLWKIEKGQ